MAAGVSRGAAKAVIGEGKKPRDRAPGSESGSACSAFAHHHTLC
jgi:hypothetical protein